MQNIPEHFQDDISDGHSQISSQRLFSRFLFNIIYNYIIIIYYFYVQIFILSKYQIFDFQCTKLKVYLGRNNKLLLLQITIYKYNRSDLKINRQIERWYYIKRSVFAPTEIKQAATFKPPNESVRFSTGGSILYI